MWWKTKKDSEVKNGAEGRRDKETKMQSEINTRRTRRMHVYTVRKGRSILTCVR